MAQPTKSHPPSSPSQSENRLTFSAWPPKVDGVGTGVERAFIVALVVCALLAASPVISAFKPAAPNPLFTAAAAYIPKPAR